MCFLWDTQIDRINRNDSAKISLGSALESRSIALFLWIASWCIRLLQLWINGTKCEIWKDFMHDEAISHTPTTQAHKRTKKRFEIDKFFGFFQVLWIAYWLTGYHNRYLVHNSKWLWYTCNRTSHCSRCHCVLYWECSWLAKNEICCQLQRQVLKSIVPITFFVMDIKRLFC